MAAIVIILGVFGLMLGSFLNVCIGRLPAGESIAYPASRCPKCRAPLAWYDNIPLVSYFALGGRCRACHEPISARYPIVEAATAVAFMLQGFVFGDDLSLLAMRLVFSAILIVLFGTDLETQRLPNVLTLPGAAVGLLSSIWLPPGIISSVAGLLLGGGILLAVRWGWKRATGVDAMGLGDVKMLAMIGAFLGWEQIWIVLFLASIAGAIIGILLAVFGGRSMQSKLPFGTFLALAAFVASLAGESMLDWYLDTLYR